MMTKINSRTLCFRDRFDAAHRLRDYGGQCANLHGHGYEVYVEIESEFMADDKFLIDYNDLKKVLKLMDHSTLVWEHDLDLLDFVEKQGSKAYVMAQQTTTEHICTEIAHHIRRELGVAEARITVEVKETPKGGCVYSLMKRT